VRVIGMSPDPPGALEAFCGKYDLRFTFLSDPDHKTLDAYGAWGERPGRDPGVIRSTVLLGPDGNVDKVWYRVAPDGHAAQVLEALSSSEGKTA
jgi:peroxiredoxin Q/BCP